MMCVYCDEGYKLPIFEERYVGDSFDISIRDDDRDYVLVISHRLTGHDAISQFSKCIPIEFCPMCGRKLDEKSAAAFAERC